MICTVADSFICSLNPQKKPPSHVSKPLRSVHTRGDEKVIDRQDGLSETNQKRCPVIGQELARLKGLERGGD